MHDRNGTPLNIGDTVILEGIITQLYGGEDYCNVTIQATGNVRPNLDRHDFHTFNTGELCLTRKGNPEVGDAAQEGIVEKDNQC